MEYWGFCGGRNAKICVVYLRRLQWIHIPPKTIIHCCEGYRMNVEASWFTGGIMRSSSKRFSQKVGGVTHHVALLSYDYSLVPSSLEWRWCERGLVSAGWPTVPHTARDTINSLTIKPIFILFEEREMYLRPGLIHEISHAPMEFFSLLGVCEDPV